MSDKPDVASLVLTFVIKVPPYVLNADEAIKRLVEIGCDAAGSRADHFVGGHASQGVVMGCVVEAVDSQGGVVIVNVAGELPS